MALKKLSDVDFSSVVNRKTSGGGGVSTTTKPNIGEPKLNTGEGVNIANLKVEPKAVVTDTGKTGGFNFEEAVRSPYDISELNSYLYDSDLQNVFKDYQENIAILNA
ncbi:MAG: hypothetical protein PHY83_05950, partial [Bacilli bacterium]|nr:hypothetical protein [Bacilli bacterium]